MTSTPHTHSRKHVIPAGWWRSAARFGHPVGRSAAAAGHTAVDQLGRVDVATMIDRLREFRLLDAPVATDPHR